MPRVCACLPACLQALLQGGDSGNPYGGRWLGGQGVVLVLGLEVVKALMGTQLTAEEMLKAGRRGAGCVCV